MQNNSYYENIIIYEWVRKWFYNNYFSNKSCFNLTTTSDSEVVALLLHSDRLQELH